MKRTTLCIILAVLLIALIISGIMIKTRKTETAESKPVENVLVEEETSAEITEDNQATEATVNNEVKREETVKKTTVKLHKKTTNKPAADVKTKEEVQQVSVEKTDIDPELLKNEPRSEVVVVDKEYKIRRLGKYIFR